MPVYCPKVTERRRSKRLVEEPVWASGMLKGVNRFETILNHTEEKQAPRPSHWKGVDKTGCHRRRKQSVDQALSAGCGRSAFLGSVAVEGVVSHLSEEKPDISSMMPKGRFAHSTAVEKARWIVRSGQGEIKQLEGIEKACHSCSALLERVVWAVTRQ